MSQVTRQLVVRWLVLTLMPAMAVASAPWAQAHWPASPLLQRICMTSGDMSSGDAASRFGPMDADAQPDKCCSRRSTDGDAPAGTTSESELPCPPHSDSCPCCKFLFFTSAWTVPAQEPMRLAAVETFSEPVAADARFAGNWVHRMLRPPCL